MNRSYHFPFVVHSQGVGTFTYLNSTDECFRIEVNGNRLEFIQPLSYFLERNARQNPNNEPDKDYYISSGLGENPVIDYAEETARNMFGRNESRGIVNFGLHGGGLVDGLKIKSPSEVAALVNVKTIGIEDAFIQNGEIKSAKLSGRAGFVIASDNFATFSAPTKEQALRKEVDRLTGELTAAHATIQKVREALRTQEGEDVQAHAKVLRQMADALVKLWHGE
ncbi:hypothetical protein [Klebsiella phage vB_KpnS_SXFY507]|nr:hypothetical protein KMI8_71 [Klebsiella phage KMI8]UPU15818.1 hypothetical protein [Klebsiella phage vB_KpnS_SXFY507]